MPKELAKHLPFLNETTRAQLFGSIALVGAYPVDDPIRVGAIDAYDQVMKTMVIAATVIGLSLSFLTHRTIRLTSLIYSHYSNRYCTYHAQLVLR